MSDKALDALCVAWSIANALAVDDEMQCVEHTLATIGSQATQDHELSNPDGILRSSARENRRFSTEEGSCDRRCDQQAGHEALQLSWPSLVMLMEMGFAMADC